MISHFSVFSSHRWSLTSLVTACLPSLQDKTCHHRKKALQTPLKEIIAHGRKRARLDLLPPVHTAQAFLKTVRMARPIDYFLSRWSWTSLLLASTSLMRDLAMTPASTRVPRKSETSSLEGFPPPWLKHSWRYLAPLSELKGSSWKYCCHILDATRSGH